MGFYFLCIYYYKILISSFNTIIPFTFAIRYIALQYEKSNQVTTYEPTCTIEGNRQNRRAGTYIEKSLIYCGAAALLLATESIELSVQSSLNIFAQKYLHKCEGTYFIFQNKYLRNYKDSFGVKLLRDDCNLSMFLLTYTCQNQLHMLSYG